MVLCVFVCPGRDLLHLSPEIHAYVGLSAALVEIPTIDLFRI